MNRILFILSFLFVSTIVCAEKEVDISGKWQFKIDRNNLGEKEKWYECKFDETISLPGSMPEMLKGDDVTVNTKWTATLYDSSYYFNPYMEKYRKEGNIKLPFFLTPDKHYVGVAWYRKDIIIPSSWKGERIILFLERPHIETTVWINNKKVGMRNSLCVAHEYDVTSYIKAGKCSIAIRVDNRIKDINVGADSHSVTDQTQGNWNGIVGKMSLMAKPKISFDDIQIFPDVDKKTALVKIKFNSFTSKSIKGELKISAESFNTDGPHIIPSVTKSIIINKGYDEKEFIISMGKDVKLWDEFSPSLYRMKLTINTEYGSDVRDVDFGMRKFEIKGKWFYVNGRKVMLRGTVENCDFPQTGYAPMDVESWTKVFNKCKEYGLNHMRFHSYCPPEAAFTAADMVGFYLQPEGPSWPNHGPKLGLGQPIDKYLMDETIALTKSYGNHASYCMLACGNEPSGNWVKWVSNFVDYWKKKDNRRVYTGASVGQGWQWQPKNEYHVKAGGRGLTWRNKRPATNDDFRFQNRLDTIKQPYVSHETGQWCAFPDFNEINRYTGVNKAKNFEIFRDLLKDNKMEDMSYWFMMASGKLQALCYKYEIEKTLRTPDYAGFQLLSLNDYSGQGTALVGVLNVFFEEKGYIDSFNWRKFCSPIVPLMRSEKFVFENNELFTSYIEVANFSEETIRNAEVSYTVKDQNGSVIYKDSFKPMDIPIGNLNKIGKLEFSLNKIKKASK